MRFFGHVRMKTRIYTRERPDGSLAGFRPAVFLFGDPEAALAKREAYRAHPPKRALTTGAGRDMAGVSNDKGRLSHFVLGNTQ